MDAYSQEVKVIITTYTKGKGTPDDPVRKVTAYFELNGKPICEKDPFLNPEPSWLAIFDGDKT